eukprot:355407-Chlamydomonas_euryale.AAC.1
MGVWNLLRLGIVLEASGCCVQRNLCSFGREGGTLSRFGPTHKCGWFAELVLWCEKANASCDSLRAAVILPGLL